MDGAQTNAGRPQATPISLASFLELRVALFIIRVITIGIACLFALTVPYPISIPFIFFFIVFLVGVVER